jgi:uncharacterized membrane protein YgcG
MRNKLPGVPALLFLALLPLGWAGGVARAAGPQGPGNFKVVLSDGSSMMGAITFVISLDTQYGVIKIPSSLLLSARFDSAHQWADIRLNESELVLNYKPASSDIKAATSAGPLKIQLTKLVTIDNGSVPPPSAANLNAAANPAGVPPPSPYILQPAPMVMVPPPTYPYPPQQPYYYPPDYYAQPDYNDVGPAPYLGPDYGAGVLVGPGFGGYYGGGFRGDFRGGFRGGAGGGERGGAGGGERGGAGGGSGREGRR